MMPFAVDKDVIAFEQKVWGTVKHFRVSQSLLSSRLFTEKGFRCSIHKHEYRYNYFLIKTGILIVDVWSNSLGVSTLEELAACGSPHEITLLPDESLTVAPGIFHRFRVKCSGELTELYWADNPFDLHALDIVRLDVGGPL